MNKKIILLSLGLIFLIGLVIAGTPANTYISDTITYFKGKIGIGTDSPSVELEVIGNSIISGSLTTNDLNVENTTIASNIVGVSSEGSQLYLASRSEDIDWTNSSAPVINDVSPNTNNDGTYYGLELNHGTVSGGVTIEDGAMVFDGGSGYISFTDDSFFDFGENDIYAISLWFKTTNSSQFLIAKNGRGGSGSIDINMNINGQIETRNNLGSSEITTSLSYNDGNIHHLIMINDRTASNNIKLYIDNELVGTTTRSNFSSPSSLPLTIGRRSDSTTWWNGTLDNIQFFLNHNLGVSEITEIYNAGKDAYSPISDGLVAQYSGRDYNGTASSPDTIFDTNFLSSKDENLNSLNFDGVDDYVDLSSNIVLSDTSFTLSLWYYGKNVGTTPRSNLMGQRLAYNKGTGFDLNSGMVIFKTRNSSSLVESLQTPISWETWNHIVGTYDLDSNTIKFYFQGNKIDSKNGVLLEDLSGSVVTIGSSNIIGGTSSSYFNGSIAQPLIFDRALSGDEITALYNRQKVYFTDNNPAGRLGDFGIKGDLIMSDLAGTGNDYACIDENGTLYRSASACS